MTVNELIEHLKTVAPERRDLECRLWLPGSQFTIDGPPIVRLPSPLNASVVIILEGNMVPGSALQPDADEEIYFR
jgi:hypothetical protein